MESTRLNTVANGHDPTGKRDSCQGDNGGPLQTYSGPAKLVGIASFGAGHCGSSLPGIYTSVAHYIDSSHMFDPTVKFKDDFRSQTMILMEDDVTMDTFFLRNKKQ